MRKLNNSVLNRSWDYEIELLRYSEGVDADGFPVESQEQGILVLANKLPVRSSEFYSASQVGYVIEKTFEINAIEYDGQETLRFENEIYRIRRTFEIENIVELYCEKRDDSHV